jgi:large subunit ribosomal protein L5
MADKEKKPKAKGEEPAKGEAKPEKPAKAARPEKAEKAEKPAKAPKAEKAAEVAAPAAETAPAAKAEKAEKPAKEPKAEKPAKEPKAEKAEKAEKATRGEKKAKGEAAPAEAGAPAEKKEKETLPPPPPPRLFERYKNEIRPRLKQTLGYPNDMAVPKITKVVISMGVGAALQNPKRLEEAQKHLTQLAGQKAVTTKARVSIANFRLREGNAIGCKVTLRRARMYEFLDRLVSVAIPRIRDFRGLSPKAFDGRGNYSLGLTEQVVFPEIDADRVEFTQGMNIAVCTTAQTDKEAYELLASFGFPFRQS